MQLSVCAPVRTALEFLRIALGCVSSAFHCNMVYMASMLTWPVTGTSAARYLSLARGKVPLALQNQCSVE